MEETKPRTVQDIEQEYVNTCVSIGDMHIRSMAMKQDQDTAIAKAFALIQEKAKLIMEEQDAVSKTTT